MKKLAFTFLTLLLTICTFGQTNINDLERIDGLWTKKGEKTAFNGDFIETFENGKTKGTGSFVNGQLEGLRIQFYENGQKKNREIL